MAQEPKKPAATPAKPAEPKTVPGLRIASKTAGFRRAGRAWSAEATDVRVSEFSKAQIEALRSEPMLVVADVEIPAAE